MKWWICINFYDCGLYMKHVHKGSEWKDTSFCLLHPLMASDVVDVHFLHFKQVFIASSPTALYDCRHRIPHTLTIPCVLDSGLSLPHCSPSCLLEHILFHFFSFSYSIRHCFMTGPVFDDVFRERGEKKTFITESYEWRVEPNGRRCASLRWSELLRLGCVAIYLIVCQREKMSNMYKYCKDSPRFCVALIKRLEIR